MPSATDSPGGIDTLRAAGAPSEGLVEDGDGASGEDDDGASAEDDDAAEAEDEDAWTTELVGNTPHPLNAGLVTLCSVSLEPPVFTM
jgi:hypothetical protein